MAASVSLSAPVVHPPFVHHPGFDAGSLALVFHGSLEWQEKTPTVDQPLYSRKHPLILTLLNPRVTCD